MSDRTEKESGWYDVELPSVSADGVGNIQQSAVFSLKVLTESEGRRTPSVESIVGAEEKEVGIEELAAKLGVELVSLNTTYSQLVSLKLPFVVLLLDGTYRTVLSIDSGHAEVRRREYPSSHVVTRRAFESRWSGRAYVVPTQNEQTGNWSRSKLYLEYIRRFRSPISQAMFVSGFLQCLSLCMPIVILLVIDKVINHNGMDTLDVLVTGLVAVGMFEFALAIVRDGIVKKMAIQTDVELGSRLYGKLTTLPLSWFRETAAGDIVARFADLARIRDFVAVHSTSAIMDAVFSVVFLAVLYVMHPELSLIVAISLPVYALVAWLSGAIQGPTVAERDRRSASNHARLVETLTAIECVKSMGLEGNFREQWNREIAEYGRASVRAHNVVSFSNQTAELVNRLVMAAILWLGTNDVIAGQMSLGQFIAFNLLAMRLSGPVLRVTRFWLGYQQVRHSSGRVHGILETESEYNGTISPERGTIEFRNVTFRYPGNTRDTLSGVNLTIPEKGLVGVVGRSGSGKSTLLRMVHGLQLPGSGVVRVGGVDIREVNRIEWRKRVGVMLQDDVLFACTVAENIAVRDNSMSWERVIRAAKVAGAHEFIVGMARGYNTVVGERGCTLSGGQRKRLGLARALACNPELLVLDEPTAGLEKEYEVRFRKCLAAIAKKRAVVVATHRLEFLRVADFIVVIDEGRVVELGGHAELMARNGVYATLARHENSSQ